MFVFSEHQSINNQKIQVRKKTKRLTCAGQNDFIITSCAASKSGDR